MAEIVETKLSNGLMILSQEVHSAPVASCWAWYRVGSRNEQPGITGASHWVEHMLFKGGAEFAKGQIFKQVNKNGGVLNGQTSRDFTTYFETLPADRLDLALRIERDRMTNAVFDPAEFEAERTVVISEREGIENEPMFVLNEDQQATAFREHPYRWSVVGWKEDLRSMTRDDLYSYYRRHYNAANAVLVVVGDFETAELITRIEELFGDVPAGEQAADGLPAEPPQIAERRVVLRRPGGAAYVLLGYHSPPAGHEDSYALGVLDTILSGAKSMGSGGGSGHRTSRLFHALVEAGLAVDVGSAYQASKDPFLMHVWSTVREGVNIEKVEQAIRDELKKTADEHVTAEELGRAVTQIRASFAYSGDGVTSLARRLGAVEMTSSYKLLDTFIDRIETVTAADVQRVAQSYLRPDNCTFGWFLPTGEPGGSGTAVAGGIRVPRSTALGWPCSSHVQAVLHVSTRHNMAPDIERFSVFHLTPPAPRLPFIRKSLDNGVAVIASENHASATTVIVGSLPAGAIWARAGQMGVNRFTSGVIQRGTDTRSFNQIFAAFDSCGASMSVRSGRHTVDFAIKCLGDRWRELFGVLLDVLRQPAFPEDHVEKVRGLILTERSEDEDDTGFVAMRALHRQLYPAGHPYHHNVSGDKETIAAMTRADLAAFHKRHYGPDGSIFVIVGDVDAQRAADAMAGAIADWQAPPRPAQPALTAEHPSKPQREDIEMSNKMQCDVVLGFKGIARSHEDYIPLLHGTQIVGGMGLMGRLGDNVRDRQGLAYYAYASMDASPGELPWIVRAGVNPANVSRTIDSIRDELRRLRDEPVLEDELDDVKAYLTGVMPIRIETAAGRARMLHSIEFFKLGGDYLDRYADIINGVTVERIQSAAQKHINLESCTIVVAGPESK